MNQVDWDKYFLRIAREVAKNSSCMSRKIGAVLVKDKAIISTGYNGPARGVHHCDERDKSHFLKLDGRPDKDWKGLEQISFDKFIICPRRALGYKSGEGLHLCQAGHAERNALIQAGRNGISTKETTLYCWCPIPCKDCIVEIINAGVKRLVFLSGPSYDNYAYPLLYEARIRTMCYAKEEI